jgi:type IV pilus assembly protein PilB
MDVDRFLVAAATKLVIDQRLVRCICKNCSEPTTMDDRTIDHLHLIGVTDDVIKDLKPFKGKGCEKCTKIGYKGRHPVFEVMPIKDKRLIAGITAGKPTEELTRIFIECGYWTLQDFAMHLVNKGVTTLDEAFKVCVGKAD